MVTDMNFGQTLFCLRGGSKCAREGWNGKNMWIALEDTSRWTASNMRPFIYMKAADGRYVPWVASQTDLLAEDWLAISEEN